MRRYVPPDKTGHTAKPAVPATETQQQLAKPAVPSENQQHGSRGQKRQLIAEKLLADPEMSDLAIARVVGVNRETVAKVRRGMVTRAASDA
jgi:AraC-like DNA-binding protein